MFHVHSFLGLTLWLLVAVVFIGFIVVLLKGR